MDRTKKADYMHRRKKRQIAGTAFALAFSMMANVFSAPAGAVRAKQISKAKKTAEFTLSAAGDCTLASDIKQPASVNFPAMYQKKGPEYFLKKVRPVFAKDDLTLVNLEGTLSSRGARVNKKWAFRGKPAYVKVLKKGFVEAVSFSNNHSYDYGRTSHTDTMKILREAGVSYSTETKTCIYKVNGIRVGLVSINSIQGNYNAVAYLRQAMKRIKKKKPDVIVASMHSGIERTQTIQPVQKTLARTAIDMGADLVLGHHPHVIQGLGRYKGRYIVYSLGNFCFGGNTNPADKDSFIFQMTFRVKKNGKVRRVEPRVVPVRLSGTYHINNYQPVLCKGAGKTRIIQRLNQYSSVYGVRIKKDGSVEKK